jgi:NADP-reducing hydrogenase subunit HndD
MTDRSSILDQQYSVAISEEFGKEPGGFTTGQLVASLKALGFDQVLDTNTAADLTVVEEGTELLHRLKRKASQSDEHRDSSMSSSDEPEVPTLPLFTSCCPGWLNCVEKGEPGLTAYISTCKSPHMMYGAVIKEFSDRLFNLSPDQIYLTSVMPCVRKRGESDQPVFSHDGVRDVDNVITTKDLGSLLRLRGIDPAQLEPRVFDSPFQTDGTGSGAGQLFGATGGVMEAAVRTVYEIVTGESLPRLELEEVRGLDGVKEAIIPLYTEGMTGTNDQMTLRVAVCSGLGNAKQLIKKLMAGDVTYDFVEVMACPGGCINGGGQPIGKPEVTEQRLKTVYELDRSLPVRKSHENPTVKAIYEKLIGEAGGETAHRLLRVKPVYGGTVDDTSEFACEESQRS